VTSAEVADDELVRGLGGRAADLKGIR